MKQNYLFLYTRSYFNPLNRTLSWKFLHFMRSLPLYFIILKSIKRVFFQRNQVHASRGHAIQSYSCTFYNWSPCLPVSSVLFEMLFFFKCICRFYLNTLMQVMRAFAWTQTQHSHTRMLCMVYSTHLLGTAVEKDSIASLSPQIFPSLPMFTGCLHHTASLHWQ